MNKRKTVVFLTALLALVACSNNPNNGSRGKIVRSTSREAGQTSVISENASKQESKDESVKSSEQINESSESPISSSKEQVSSSESPISGSQESSSANTSESQDEPFEYESYLLKHTEGQKAEYVFEAECTNLGGKEGPGYSGANSESDMAVFDMENGCACVTYLYKKGCSLNFFIVSDRDVENAEMSLSLGGEFIVVNLNPEKYQIRVDYPDSKYLEPAESSVDGCLGYWDALFLDVFKNPSVNGGYYINTWECGPIEIDAQGSSDIVGYFDYKITGSLKLKKGITCISLITANSENVGMGTMAANAPVVDSMTIKTTAQLGMFDQKDNFQGTNGCHFKA